MAVSESNMSEFKMAAIIKLSQNEWVKGFFCANGGNQSWEVWVSLRGKTKMFGCPPYIWMMFGCPLYIHNTKKGYFVRQRRCTHAPYICIPPVHKQHKESMLCQTKGVSICPHRFRYHHMLGYHLYVGMPPLCLDAAICLDAPPVCLNGTLCLEYPHMFGHPCMLGCPHMFGHLHMFGYPPVCLDIPHMFALPICLGAPYLWTPLCMVGHPHIFRHPLYVWMSSICFGFPLCVWMWASKHMAVSKCIRGIQNKHHKESMLCQTKGVSICPHRFRCHHMLGYHLYVGMPPLCLDAAICLDAPPVCLNGTLCLNTPICLDTPVCLDVPICLDIFIYLDAHLYVWTYPICLHSPYVWMPLYVWVAPIFGHPSVWLDIPTYLDTPCMFGCPPYVLASPCVFGCGHPNIWQCPNVLGASKHTGGYPNIWGHPYILGPQTWMGTSKHMAESKHIGGHPNIWGHPNIQWVHPKILGNPHKWGCPNMEGDIQTCRMYVWDIQTSSKHTGGIPAWPSYPAKWVLPLVPIKIIMK